MTKSKKRYRVEQEEKSRKASAEDRLATRNDAYTQGAFSYLRLLTHNVGMLQFAYGIYYHWFYVHAVINRDVNVNENELKKRWGGTFKYLTFLNMILQMFYHLVALLNDLFGSNAVGGKHFFPAIRKLRDYMFAAWAFPIAHTVCISFWVIYVLDRELIFPRALDAVYPNWLNHVSHTNIAMLAILDIFTCFRQYPSRKLGLTGTITFMLTYIAWMHIIYFVSGHWVYPLLNILNLPLRYLMLSVMLGFSSVCYFLGERLNNLIWSPELSLLKEENVEMKKTA